MSRHTDGDFSVSSLVDVQRSAIIHYKETETWLFLCTCCCKCTTDQSSVCVEIFSECHTGNTLCSAAGCSAVENDHHPVVVPAHPPREMV